MKTPPLPPHAMPAAGFDMSSDRLASRLAARAYGAALILQGIGATGHRFAWDTLSTICPPSAK